MPVLQSGELKDQLFGAGPADHRLFGLNFCAVGQANPSGAAILYKDLIHRVPRENLAAVLIDNPLTEMGCLVIAAGQDSGSHIAFNHY